MLRKITTASLIGIDAETVFVEIDIQPGLPYVHLVGLADTTIKEARERVRAAIVNSGFEFPKQRITVSLSPAGIPKEGSHFDLPIAVGILGTVYKSMNTEDCGFIGELSLDGTLKSVRGALPLAMRLREEGIRKIIVPKGNAQEISLLNDVELYIAESLRECIDILFGRGEKRPYRREDSLVEITETILDFSDVKGNENAKRALAVAAAGNHGILLMGIPGCGKTMMAKRMPYILPEMTYGEMLEVARIHSAAGNLNGSWKLSGQRPFRAPHHTITKAALIGGGVMPRPGEISLAHNGVLFLDEFGEFNPAVLELLRQPIEEGIIPVRRLKMEVEFPCRLMLVAASNPCKCGYYGDDEHICTCTAKQLESYYSRFSGPMLDRIDMHVNVEPVDETLLKSDSIGMSTSQMKEMVERAVLVQRRRYRDTGILFNSRLQEADIKKFCTLDSEGQEFLQTAYRTYGLSMRAYNKLQKVSRTIADIDGAEKIKPCHIAEALQYRSLENFYRR